jgi:hypothetical protein
VDVKKDLADASAVIIAQRRELATRVSSPSSSLSHPDDDAREACEHEEPKNRDDDIRRELVVARQRLYAAMFDRAPYPDDPAKRELFVILRWDGTDGSKRRYRYTVIRGQIPYCRQEVRRRASQARKFARENDADKGEDITLSVIDCFLAPNGCTYFNRCRTPLRSYGVDIDGVDMDLSSSWMDETDLIAFFREAHAGRLNADRIPAPGAPAIGFGAVRLPATSSIGFAAEA